MDMPVSESVNPWVLALFGGALLWLYARRRFRRGHRPFSLLFGASLLLALPFGHITHQAMLPDPAAADVAVGTGLVVMLFLVLAGLSRRAPPRVHAPNGWQRQSRRLFRQRYARAVRDDMVFEVWETLAVDSDSEQGRPTPGAPVAVQSQTALRTRQQRRPPGHADPDAVPMAPQTVEVLPPRSVEPSSRGN